MPGEEVFYYLSASPQAVGAALIKEEHGIQRPIYYVSHALKDAELMYPNVQKFAYALVVAARKLRSYFQGRTIIVLTDQPLRQFYTSPIYQAD